MNPEINYPYHDFFIDGAWNLENIKKYFGDFPTILTGVLEGKNCPVDIVKYLLKQGADINGVDKSGHSPLLIAVGCLNNVEVIRVLLEAGAEVNKVDASNRTPLLKYLQRKDCSVAIVEVLLDFEADVNHKDIDGDSILITAIRNARDDAVIRVLVERGAEVNDLSNAHITPLLVLLRNRNSVDIVKLLLAKGADVNCVDKCGSSCSPLKTAIRKARGEEVIQALLENGAEVNIAYEYGDTPLLLYLGQRYLANNNFSVGIVKLLLHYKADVNAMNSSGDSSLATALKHSCSKTIIQMLLEGGAGVDALDHSGRSPLCIAFRYSSNDIVKLLLNAGSSPNACTYHKAPLYCATDFSHSELREDILKLLLERNVNLNFVDENGQSVLCFALQHGAKASDIQLLMDAGASLNTCNQHSSPLICATGSGSGAPLREDVVKLLLDKGACVDDKHLDILQEVVRFCNYEAGAIQLLLDLPGMDTYIIANEALLHHAVLNPNLKLKAIKLLLSRKAQVHSENKFGESPLHCALRNRKCDPSVINLLLQNGSPANAKNRSGETPLHCALGNETCDSSVINLLLQNGSQVNAKNKSGKTPLVLALEEPHCHANILKELLIGGAHIEEEIFYRGYTLLEFLAREYQLSTDEKTLSFSMLAKFFFLKYPKYDICDLINASVVVHQNRCFVSYGINKISDFVEKCLGELREMDMMQVSNERTFREFVAGNPNGVNYELRQVLEDISKNAFPVFLDVIFSRFPVFRDIIFARVKKSMVEQKYCPNSLSIGKFELVSVILGKVATFSSDDDFLRFILAFYKPSETTKSDSEKTLLGKRNFEPSSKPNKFIKLCH